MPADIQFHSPTPEEVMAYLDGEVPLDEATRIAAHLAGCKECEMVADSFRRLSQQTAGWQVESAPASMRVPVAPLAQRPRRLLSWRPSRFVLAGLTTAAAALVLISFRD